LTRRGHQRLVLWVIATSWLMASCETVPAGPSLSNVTLSPAVDTVAGWKASQLPTVFTRGSTTVLDPTVCCCHVRGTIRNGNSVPLHVLIRFSARDARDESLSEIVFFERDLPAGASNEIKGANEQGAPGFLLPCASIDHLKYQLDVSSVGPPLL
jgi:hypothetical protein